jgi:hypothetical protein
MRIHAFDDIANQTNSMLDHWPRTAKIRNQKSEIKNQKSEIKNQKSKIRNQKSELFRLNVCDRLDGRYFGLKRNGGDTFQ